jgi:hypothetical protein
MAQPKRRATRKMTPKACVQTPAQKTLKEIRGEKLSDALNLPPDHPLVKEMLDRADEVRPSTLPERLTAETPWRELGRAHQNFLIDVQLAVALEEHMASPAVTLQSHLIADVQRLISLAVPLPAEMQESLDRWNALYQACRESFGVSAEAELEEIKAGAEQKRKEWARRLGQPESDPAEGLKNPYVLWDALVLAFEDLVTACALAVGATSDATWFEIAAAASAG